MDKEPLLPSSSSSSNQQQSNHESSILIDSNYPLFPKKNLYKSKSNPSMSTYNDIENYPSPIPNPIHIVKKNSIVKQAMLLLILYLTIGVTLCSFFNDQFKSTTKTHPIIDALYFCIITLRTIGYSDIKPNSTLTKLFAILFVLVGFGFINILLTGLVTYFLDFQKNSLNKERIRSRIKVALAMSVLVFCIGIGVVFMHFVERIGWFDSFYFSVIGVTTVGYGEKVFKSMGGRIFASIWLLASTLAFARAFLLLAEVKVDEKQRELEEWVLDQDSVQHFHAADIDNNGFVSKSDYVIYKLKELGKITERDVLLISKYFERWDTGNSGKITLSDLFMESDY
ncbi:two-pore potassium channel 3-like [Nicotiana tomentosiformis]|uniref:two-pore potassium channel 3-like n=1 Tax=Nicotiana tomentosiformis TaxID=4098 RepID=UPI00051C39B7|nr:two-pore potassium channel 3-like [Nicotiana tomentosiformis]